MHQLSLSTLEACESVLVFLIWLVANNLVVTGKMVDLSIELAFVWLIVFFFSI